MVLFTYDKVNKLIIIPKAWYTTNDYQVTIQQLINDIRNFEDDDNGMDIPRIADASGKQNLGGGVLVGITLTLYDWKIKFEDYGSTPCSTTVTCNITGGNLVAYNTTSGLYVNPIEPSNCITVTITASSSATLSELGAIQYGSFDGGVWIDQVNGTAGTDYPAGTPQQPVDNITDAKSIATTRGFSTFYIIGDLTLTASDDITDYTVVGASQDKTKVYLENGCTVDNCEFETSAISGSMGRSVVNFFDCRFEDIVYDLENGYMRNCILAGTLKVWGDEGQVVDVLSCYSGVPGTGSPNIDFQGTYSELGMRSYAGGVQLQNLSHPSSNVSVDLLSGRCKLAYSCTSGTVVCRGVGRLMDPSGNNITTGIWNNNVNIINETVARGVVTSILHEGTVQSATNSTITLASDASSVDGAYDPSMIQITNGTGIGQSRTIFQYDGTTKVAAIDRNWKVIPNTTSNYAITAWPAREHVHEGLAQAATATTITLNPLASGDDDAYIRQAIFLRAGLGDDQVRLVTAYDGTTKIATVDSAWDTTPDATTVYVMIPSRYPTEETITSPVWHTVYIDAETGTAGTAFPIGTAGTPVDNITDAYTIASSNNIKSFSVVGEITLNRTFAGYRFEGDSSAYNDIINMNGQTITECRFNELDIRGNISGSNSVYETCFIRGVNGINGVILNCALIDSIRLRSIGGVLIGKDCRSASNPLILDMGGAMTLAKVHVGGDVTLYSSQANIPGQNVQAQLSMDIGNLTLDASNTGGNIIVRGLGKVTDNSNGSTVNMAGTYLTEGDFGGAVWVDVNDGTAGTNFPLGTPTYPVSNIADGRTIADTYGFEKFHVDGLIHLDQEYDGYIFVNDSPELCTINLSGQSTQDAVFSDITLSGQCSGSIRADRCIINGITNLAGTLYDTDITANFSVKPGVQTRFRGGTVVPTLGVTIDMNGAGWLGLNDYTGRFTVHNMTSPFGLFALVGYSEATISSSCTAGNVYGVQGTNIIDNSTSLTSLTENAIWDAVWNEPMNQHTTTGTFGSGMKFIYDIEGGRWKRDGTQMTFYDASGTTVVATFDLKKADGSAAGESDDVYERTRA